jgi:hypothetical protein
MNLTKSLALGLAVSALAALPALADVSAGFRVSTLGPGLDFTTSVVPDTLSFRINGNYFEYTHDSSLSGVKYHEDLKLETAGFLGNWYPWQNSFFFTAGGYENTSKIDVRARTANGNYNFNGATYSITQAGTVAGKVKLGREFALFTGSPKLSLNSSGGTLSNDPTFKNNIEQERQRDQNSVSWADVYPVLAIGLAYKF